MHGPDNIRPMHQHPPHTSDSLQKKRIPYETNPLSFEKFRVKFKPYTPGSAGIASVRIIRAIGLRHRRQTVIACSADMARKIWPALAAPRNEASIPEIHNRPQGLCKAAIRAFTNGWLAIGNGSAGIRTDPIEPILLLRISERFRRSINILSPNQSTGCPSAPGPAKTAIESRRSTPTADPGPNPIDSDSESRRPG